MSIYNYTMDVVQEPNLSSVGQHRTGGLTMKFVSSNKIPLNDYVEAEGTYFEVINIEMSSGTGSSDDLLLYTCRQLNSPQNDIDIRYLNKAKVLHVTDLGTITRIKELLRGYRK